MGPYGPRWALWYFNYSIYGITRSIFILIWSSVLILINAYIFGLLLLSMWLSIIPSDVGENLVVAVGGDKGIALSTDTVDGIIKKGPQGQSLIDHTPGASKGPVQILWQLEFQLGAVNHPRKMPIIM